MLEYCLQAALGADRLKPGLQRSERIIGFPRSILFHSVAVKKRGLCPRIVLFVELQKSVARTDQGFWIS